MTAIIVKDLSVDIPIFDVASSSIRQLLLRRAVGGQVAQQGSHVVVNALKQIGFEAHDGDRIGLVGPNGAGKTTLLRVLADIYPPTSGTVEVVGRVSPMFDNNLGMNADATGLENIRLCGLLWGLTPAQIENSIDDIAEFTELGGYLNMPVRTYSQGMQMRLAFAIVTIRERRSFSSTNRSGSATRNFSTRPLPACKVSSIALAFSLSPRIPTR